MTAIVAEAGMEGALTRARSGDEEAFAALVTEHQSMVFSIALRALNDRTRAEEIAQDVFLQLFRKRHQIESPSHLLFWLRQVTARRCIDALRQRPWRLVSFDTTGEIPTTEASPDPLLARSLRKSVAALPPMQRLIITLRYQEELEIAEIASVVRLPLNTVKSHLHRALQVLRRQMEVRG